MKYRTLPVSFMVLMLCVFSMTGEEAFAINRPSINADDAMNEAEGKKTQSPSTGMGKAEEPQERKDGQSKAVELKEINNASLTDRDFTIDMINLGDSISLVRQRKGIPQKVIHGYVSDEYVWDESVITANKELPYAYQTRRDLQLKNVLYTDGVSKIYTRGKEVAVQRGIMAGDSRENVLRAYGCPDKVFWDGGEKEFYLLYRKAAKELSFILKDDAVYAFQLSVNNDFNLPVYNKTIQNQSGRMAGGLSDEDFHLAGFNLGERFDPHPWDNWQKKLSNPKEDVWYFSGYAVRSLTKGGMIESLFLTDHNMMTGRGLSLGDDVSTAELLYGPPNKVEMDVSSGHPKTSYIYFSKDKRKVLIIFLNKQKVDGIILTKNPQLSGK